MNTNHHIFFFSIGGPFGPSYSISLKDDLFEITTTTGGMTSIEIDETILHIHLNEVASEWDNLVGILGELSWKSEYDDPQILDGTRWVLDFNWNDKVMNSSGSNAYPPEFKRFLRAVNAISRHVGVHFS